MNDPHLAAACATCPGHCCRGELVMLSAEEADHGAYVAMQVVDPFGSGREVWALAHKPNGDCHYLSEAGRCSIYTHRPVICRAFDCGDWLAKMGRPAARRLARRDEAVRGMVEKGRQVRAARLKDGVTPCQP